jgi:hypothetical protein
LASKIRNQPVVVDELARRGGQPPDPGVITGDLAGGIGQITAPPLSAGSWCATPGAAASAARSASGPGLLAVPVSGRDLQ